MTSNSCLFVRSRSLAKPWQSMRGTVRKLQNSKVQQFPRVTSIGSLPLRSRPPFTGVLLGPGPESAPRSAFWAILGTCLGVLVTRIAATSKSQIASDCNRNSKKSLRLRKHPVKPNLWTRKPPVLCGFDSVSEAPHGSGNPPEYVATTRVWFWIAAVFLAQCDFCDCDTAILLRFLREKLATSKLWLPIASDLWLRLRGWLNSEPQRVLFGIFRTKKRQKALKKHSLGHSEAGAQNCPKSTPGGTFRPGP